jgi:hypothetical protein
MTPTEKQIRTAIKTLVQGVDPVVRVHDQFIPPVKGLISEFNKLAVDVNGIINVTYVSLVGFRPDIIDPESFGHKNADYLTYQIMHYRSIVAMENPQDPFYAYLFGIVDIFDLPANKQLGFDAGVSTGAVRSASIPAAGDTIGDYGAYAGVLLLEVFVGDC